MLTIQLRKYIKSLHQKKFQTKYDKFIVETPKVLNELISSQSYEIDYICGTSEWMELHKVKLNNIGAECLEISNKELDMISQLKSPHQVLAVVQKPQPAKLNPDASEWAIYLDDIQNPGNLGTIIRIADWFGIDEVIASSGTADHYNAKVIQSAMGSVFRVKVIRENFDQISDQRPIYCMDGAGKNIHQLVQLKPGILVVGNEGKGIKKQILIKADHVIAIPKYGQAESLNAAVATGIVCATIKK